MSRYCCLDALCEGISFRGAKLTIYKDKFGLLLIYYSSFAADSLAGSTYWMFCSRWHTLTSTP